MEAVSTAFVGSFTRLDQLPKENLPEIAFVGRSNVGKSSLINRLLGTKKLALTSSTPGKTRSINYFRINDKIHFVDLPGYGYAKVSKAVRDSWAPMIETYLLNSEYLKLLILLIDSRHSLQANDRQMLEWLSYNQLPHLPVLTKADKLRKNDLAKLKRKLNNPTSELHNAVICSAETGKGIKEIWSVIDAMIIN